MEKPAIMGGKATRREYLSAFRPSLDQREIREVTDTLKSGWITTGPKTRAFEQAITKYVGSAHAVAVNSCTAGLHLALLAMGIGKGDEVITTPFTFAATANVIVHTQATPVFVDIQPDTYNIDPSLIQKAITKKTKAIIAVHYGGHPCDMDEILRIAKKHKLAVIEDAAHAIGAKYRGKPIGNISDITVFSFYATKNITTSEGGMVCIKKRQDGHLAEKIRVMGLHGMSKDAYKRYAKGGSWQYEVVYPGFKYNMTDIQASLGIWQLKKIEAFTKKREAIAHYYDQQFKNLKGVMIPQVKKYVRHARHLYPILIDQSQLSIGRDEFFEALSAENIGSSVHFIPLYRHPYYAKNFKARAKHFPITEYVYARTISLPLNNAMTLQEAQDVAIAVKKIITYYQR